MTKRIALLATVAALVAMPAMAQTAQPVQPTEPAQQTRPVQPGSTGGTFISAQTADQWSASKLIGLSVKGPGDESIGSVNDLLLDEEGKVLAAVIGVGGFLGIGQKNVAVNFDAVDVMRNADGREEARLSMTKEELENAPDFKAYEAPRPAAERPATPSPKPGN